MYSGNDKIVPICFDIALKHFGDDPIKVTAAAHLIYQAIHNESVSVTDGKESLTVSFSPDEYQKFMGKKISHNQTPVSS